MHKRNKRPPCLKIVLKLPDLDHAKSAVLNSLSSPHSRRNYKFAMEQFITWYCSEPRLALNRTVVLRFRLCLESLGLAAGTVNQRLAAVRRLAYEAADSGLLSPELAAGIRRVKGAKQLGTRTGNWLTQDQARILLEKADGDNLRSVRVSSSGLCKSFEDACFPFQVESLEDGVDDSIHGQHVDEADHGACSAADLDETAFDDVGGAQLSP